MASVPADRPASRFGRAMLAHFPLEPGAIYLNHGTVGVTPNVVMRARSAILDEIERHPARYMVRELMELGMSPPPAAPRLRAAADRSPLSSAPTARPGLRRQREQRHQRGVRSFALSRATRSSSTITPTAASPAPRRSSPGARGATVATVALPFPSTTRPNTSRALEARSAAHALALLDHVTSETALVMPLAAMAAACRARGVRGARRWRACAGRDRLRHPAPRRRLVRRQPAQVGVRAAQLRHPLGRTRAAARLHPACSRGESRAATGCRSSTGPARAIPRPGWPRRPALDFMREVLGVGAMRRQTMRSPASAQRCSRERWRRALDHARVDGRLHGHGRAARATRRGPTAQRPAPARRAVRAAIDRSAGDRARRRALGARRLQVYNEAGDVERLADAVESLASA